jgi:hypothetical protein
LRKIEMQRVRAPSKRALRCLLSSLIPSHDNEMARDRTARGTVLTLKRQRGKRRLLHAPQAQHRARGKATFVFSYRLMDSRPMPAPLPPRMVQLPAGNRLSAFTRPSSYISAQRHSEEGRAKIKACERAKEKVHANGNVPERNYRER